MRFTIAALVVALGTVAAVAVPVQAFHGAAYTARGTATNIATGDEYDAVVKWSGAFGVQGGTYTIEFYDQATGAQVHKNAIPGKEYLLNVHFVGCVEVVDYTGEANVGVPGLFPGPGLGGGPILNIQGLPVPGQVPPSGGPVSGLPNPVFKIAGYQHNNLCTGIAEMHYEGHYLTVFQLVLDVWGPPGA